MILDISPSDRPPVFFEAIMQISPCPIALPLSRLSLWLGQISSLSLFRHSSSPASWAFAKSTGCTSIVVLPASATTTSSGAMERLSVDDPEDKMGAHVVIGHNRDSLGISASSAALMPMARPRIISRKTSSLPSKPAAEPAWQISEAIIPRPSRLFRRHEQGTGKLTAVIG